MTQNAFAGSPISTVAASGSALTLDLQYGDIFDVTLTAACALALPAPAPGVRFEVVLRQDATGSRTVTWPGNVAWPASGAPVLSTAAGASDVCSFVCIDGATWNGSASGSSRGSSTLVNGATTPALKVTQQGTTSASTSTGGAVNLDNSLNTGAGLVIFSSQAAPTGRLLVVRASNAGFAQNAAYFENAGAGHAMSSANTFSGTNTTGSAGNFTSTNPGASCVQISGVETGRGSLKITHTGPGTSADANASGISIDLQGASTAAQGLHIDSVAQGTTGALLDLRNNGNQLLKVISDATFAVPSLVLGNGGPLITIGTGAPAVAAPVGSLYLRTDGGASTTLYVKESGTGTTGWVAK